MSNLFRSAWDEQPQHGQDAPHEAPVEAARNDTSTENIDGQAVAKDEGCKYSKDDEEFIGSFVNSIKKTDENNVVFVEDDNDGRTGVMTMEEGGAGGEWDMKSSSVTFQSRRTRYVRMFCVFFGFICLVVLLAVGLTVANKSDETSSSVPAKAKTTKPPSAAPMGQPAGSPLELRPLSNQLLFVPDSSQTSLPAELHDIVNGFGHVLSVNSAGSKMIVSAHSHELNGYHLFVWSTTLHRWKWERLVRGEPPQGYSNPMKDHHHPHLSVSMSSGGESVAFSDNGLGFVRFPFESSFKIDLLKITNLPSQRWYGYHATMSSSGHRVALLATDLNAGNKENGSMMVQLFHKVQVTDTGTWEPVHRINLPGKASGGCLAFNSDASVLAVGTYETVDGSGEVEETLKIYKSSSASGMSWKHLGFPAQVASRSLLADQRLGGGVLSLAPDGSALAIGSYRGGQNHVVLIRYDTNTTEKWNHFGENHVLHGSDYGAVNFGASVLLRGTRLFVGAPGNSQNHVMGMVFVFDYSTATDTWSLAAQPVEGTVEGDMFGFALSADSTGTRLTVGIPHGHAHDGHADGHAHDGHADGHAHDGHADNTNCTGAVATYQLVET